jgi:hypothetical protein
MKHLKVGNMAFWHYSPWPAFLGAKITRIRTTNDYPGKGHIMAEGYSGYWFKPAFCLPLVEGEVLKEKLGIIEEDRRRLSKAVDASSTVAVQALIPTGVKVR